MIQIMKIHLGCGVDKKEGYLNCDISPLVKPDLVIDLERNLPFKDDSVDEVVANHVMEHIHNFVPLMHELWRVSKKDTLIYIRTPFYSTWGQFNDPTHVRFFTPWSFGYFCGGNYSHEVGAAVDMFTIEKVKINFGIGRSKELNWLFNPLLNLNQKVYCRFFAWIFPAAELYYELRVNKESTDIRNN
jgi:SAM-dependent methyltransferase